MGKQWGREGGQLNKIIPTKPDGIGLGLVPGLDHIAVYVLIAAGSGLDCPPGDQRGWEERFDGSIWSKFPFLPCNSSHPICDFVTVLSFHYNHHGL